MCEVKPGQVWESCDKRDGGKKVFVHEVTKTHAVVSGWASGKFFPPRRKIRLDRLRPTSTGYKVFLS